MIKFYSIDWIKTDNLQELVCNQIFLNPKKNIDVFVQIIM